MFKYSLLLVLVVGCMEPFVAPPSPPAPVSSNDLQVDVDTSTIATLFKYAGAKNEITIHDNLSMSFDDTGIHLPAGANLSYTLSPTGGVLDFGPPKPLVDAKVFGITVHPVIDRITLSQPDKASASGTDYFGIPFSREFDLPKLGTPQESETRPDADSSSSTESESTPVRSTDGPLPSIELLVESSKPVSRQNEDGVPKRSVPNCYIWTGSGQLSTSAVSTLNSETDFNLVVNPKNLNPYSNEKPIFQWSTPGRIHRQVGWPGKDEFIRRWKATQTLPPRDIKQMASYSGPVVLVHNMTPLYHLTHHHGFTADELKPYTEAQLIRIHSAAHKEDE